MFFFWKVGSRPAAILGLALLAAAPAAGPAQAGGPPWGLPSGFPLPWQRPDYHGYAERTRPAQPPPPIITAAPQKYTITITVLPQKVQGEDPNIAVVMAHLPEDALLWFDDYATKAKGMTRTFQTPPLTPGKHYSYLARVVWHEDGKWVSQTQKVSVQAGQIHCLYLTATAAGEEAKIAANLAKLSPEDRRLAEAQKYCPIQEGNRLGILGVPFKVMVKEQPVFLCCKGCAEEALQDPDKTLAKVKELEEKNAAPPRH
jgi:uncharacterized protein (TIGR03000 family)